VYRLEAERKELQEKQDAYCHHLLKVAEKYAKYKSYMKVMAFYILLYIFLS